MIDNIALDVVIGLVFIFLIYSLLATTINEGIAANLNLRGKKLEHAIKRMLDDGIHTEHTFWTVLFDLLKSIVFGIWNVIRYFRFTRPKTKEIKDMNFVELFYNEPLIKYLGEHKLTKRPSYISSDFFAKAVLKILFEKGKSPEEKTCIEGLNEAQKIQYIKRGIENLEQINETRTLFLTMIDNSNYELEKFHKKLEGWFEETMNRASGWYKKQSQIITLLIGFTIAVVFNVDTIKIVKQLSKDKDAAKKMTELSVQYVNTHKDSLGHLSEEHDSIAQTFFLRADSLVKTDVSTANQIIGLGWHYPDTVDILCNKTIKNHEKCEVPCVLRKEPIQTNWDKIKYVSSKFNFRTILGFLLTALAISFGAPFWFDLLNKIVSIRGSGTKPGTVAVAKGKK
jgi:hypothetical protein